MNEDVKIITLGYYAPSHHEATRVVDEKGIYPTVKENHQTVPAVLVEVNTDERRHQDTCCR